MQGKAIVSRNLHRLLHSNVKPASAVSNKGNGTNAVCEAEERQGGSGNRCRPPSPPTSRKRPSSSLKVRESQGIRSTTLRGGEARLDELRPRVPICLHPAIDTELEFPRLVELVGQSIELKPRVDEPDLAHPRWVQGRSLGVEGSPLDATEFVPREVYWPKQEGSPPLSATGGAERQKATEQTTAAGQWRPWLERNAVRAPVSVEAAALTRAGTAGEAMGGSCGGRGGAAFVGAERKQTGDAWAVGS